MKFKRRSKSISAMTFVLTILVCTLAMSVGAYAVPNAQADSSAPYKNRQESLGDSIEPFRDYGLTYDMQQDKVLYNGQQVRAFVDLRGNLPDGGYSFNVGYFDDEADSELYLIAVRDKNGNLTGIETMPEELKNDLDLDERYNISAEYTPDTVSETKYSMGQQDKASEELNMLDKDKGKVDADMQYMIFDATTNFLEHDITATDKLDTSDIPRDIADWIASCKEENTVNVKKTVIDGKIDAWIYYGSENRLAWNMEIIGTAVRLNLMDYAPKPVSGATIIHYQAPADYQDLEIFFSNERLEPIN